MGHYKNLLFLNFEEKKKNKILERGIEINFLSIYGTLSNSFSFKKYYKKNEKKWGVKLIWRIGKKNKRIWEGEINT